MIHQVGYESVAPQKQHALTDLHKKTRMDFRVKTLRQLKDGKLDLGVIWFSDVFSVAVNKLGLKSRNHKVRIEEEEKIDDVNTAVGCQKAVHFAKGEVIGMAISKMGSCRTMPNMLADAVTITGEVYRAMIDGHYLPQIRRKAKKSKVANADWVWQEDNARPRKRKVMKKYWAGRPRRILDWPPNSPDLNPRDFSLWSVLKNMILRKMPKTLDELKDATVEAAEEMDKDLICRMIDAFPKRLQQRIDAQGGAVSKRYALGAAAEHMCPDDSSDEESEAALDDE